MPNPRCSWSTRCRHAGRWLAVNGRICCSATASVSTTRSSWPAPSTSATPSTSSPNAAGRPYRPGEVRDLLSRQMRSQVRWWDSLQLLRRQGVTDARQLGPGDVLTKLWQAALKEPLDEPPDQPLEETATPAELPPAG